jgi:uncharacterized membrane protein YoaK (UPF0700 family)
MDAWVWMDHGHVFANAQTANVVLFGIHVAAGDFTTAARHVPPVMAFILGLVASRLSRAWLKKAGLNSRNVRLTVECVLLCGPCLDRKSLTERSGDRWCWLYRGANHKPLSHWRYHV